MTTQTVQLVLPNLHQKQAAIKREAARFNVLSCGRRFGKDILGHELAVDTLLDGLPCAWFAPSYRMMLDTFKDMRHILQPITSAVNASDHRIECVTGGVMDFWSLDGETVRGRRYKRVIINEAAMVADLMRKWNEAVRPTLADYAGDAWFLSTPRGRDGFFQLHQMGAQKRAGWSSWTFPTSDNPHIARGEIKAMRSTMPERSYLQEIEARFIDDGGGVFRRVRDAATSTPADAPDEDHTIVAGIDWSGGGADYTVVTVFDATEKREIHKERFTGLDWGMNEARVEACLRRFNVMVALGEDNGMGGPLNSNLRRKGLRVRDFHTSHETKAEIVEGLVMAFERGEIRILNDAVAINELESFESQRLPSGSVRYSAPDGAHDDAVMSLAIAWRAVSGAKGFQFG